MVKMLLDRNANIEAASKVSRNVITDCTALRLIQIIIIFCIMIILVIAIIMIVTVCNMILFFALLVCIHIQ